MKPRYAQFSMTFIVLAVFALEPASCIGQTAASSTSALWSSTATKVEAVDTIKALRCGPKLPAKRLLEVVNNARFPAWHRELCLFEYLTTYGKNISLAKLLEVVPAKLLRPENASHANSVTALPEPFKAKRRFDCEYYAVQPRVASTV